MDDYIWGEIARDLGYRGGRRQVLGGIDVPSSPAPSSDAASLLRSAGGVAESAQPANQHDVSRMHMTLESLRSQLAQHAPKSTWVELAVAAILGGVVGVVGYRLLANKRR